jgi:IS30 family transposase
MQIQRNSNAANNMSQNNVNAAKEQLRSLVTSYSRPLRGKLALLAALREEIIELDKKGATSAEIAALLAQCQITLSKDTVARFLRTEAAKERRPRAKKPAPVMPPSGSTAAPPRPMLPRGLSTSND